MYEYIDVIWLVLSYYSTLRWVVDLVTYRVTLISNIRKCSYFAFIRIISSTNFNAQFSLFINNMFVTLLSSTCFECTVQTFTEIEDTRCCVNTIFSPEDGHVNARSMLRIIV